MDSTADGRGMDALVPDSSMRDARGDGGFDGSVDSGPADSAVDTTPTDALVDTNVGDTSTSGPITIRVECEDGTIRGGMRIGADSAAFGGAYADTPGSIAEFEWEPGAAVLPPARTELAVNLPRGGTWYLWVRLYSHDGSSDAMHMGFDATDIRRVYPPRTAEWAWMHQTHDGDDDLRFDGLTPGPKTLVVGVGEPRARCDRVILTTDGAFVATETP